MQCPIYVHDESYDFRIPDFVFCINNGRKLPASPLVRKLFPL